MCWLDLGVSRGRDEGLGEAGQCTHIKFAAAERMWVLFLRLDRQVVVLLAQPCVHVLVFPKRLAACCQQCTLATAALLYCCPHLCCACPPLPLCAASLCVPCASLQCVTACPLLSCSRAWVPGQSPARTRPTGGLCAQERAGSLALPASSVAGMNGCWTRSKGAAPHQQVRLCVGLSQ